MKTLLINAHPDYTNSSHFSNQLQKKFVQLFEKRFPIEELTILTLYESDIPRIEHGELLSVWNKQASNEKLSESELKIAAQSAKLLEQFKEHHRLVIVTPLHNFNVTSRMKDYLDNVMIASETFRYIADPLENGKMSVPLLVDDYKALLLFASGSIYTQGDFYGNVDFAPHYLKMMFTELMGFSTFAIVRAEGTSILPVDEETILSKAFIEVEKAFLTLYDDK